MQPGPHRVAAAYVDRVVWLDFVLWEWKVADIGIDLALDSGFRAGSPEHFCRGSAGRSGGPAQPLRAT